MVLTSASGQNRFSHDRELRDIYTLQDERKTSGLIPYLSHKKKKYKLAAIMAMASVQDSVAANPLLLILRTDKSEPLRKAAAYSLGQLYLPSLQAALTEQFHKEKKNSVKNALLEAIGKCASKAAVPFFEQLQVKQALYEGYTRGVYFAVRRRVRSSVIIEKIKAVSVSSDDPAILRTCARILSTPKPDVPEESRIKPSMSMSLVTDSLKKITNPYQQVNFLKRYSFYPEDLYQMSLQPYETPVKTYCMEAYLKHAVQIHQQRLVLIMNSGNVAFISMACEKIMKDSVLHLADSFPVGVLTYVSDKLVLPRDLETWIDIRKTIAHVRKQPYTYTTPAFQHPIDWKYVMSIPESQKVRISTTKGQIILQCKVNDAPGSVSNFLKLVDSGYYDGKYFHRMVPDFVVQGGCPRGDGWGSLNWTQRSEFSNWLRYQPGSAGLASAGKDSEGVQFFITHTYTTNLDGRYSIFAEVTSGMEIVNMLEIGDRILKIERL
jgi:cyclophilin family peptidyl-prolyl cis-trans isomerase